MRTLAALAACLLLATLLGGCATTSSPSGTANPSASGAAAASGTAPTSRSATATSGSAPVPANRTNLPPQATLGANTTSGTAPLPVVFRLGGSDPEGGPLGWVLDLGDGNATRGEALPANVTHTFAVGGTFTVRLLVRDAGNLTANATVLLAVAPPTPAGPSICNVTPDQTVGDFYYTTADGGNWVFHESNGIAGLQVENNHPSGDEAEGLGEYNSSWEGCVNGDQLVF